MQPLADRVLVCAENDPESLLIVRIAQRLGIPTLVSAQAHGARLGAEPNFFARLAEFPSVREVVIVEIPGPEEEDALRAQGKEVTIVDHHTYPEFDRMKPTASLFQFLDVFGITREDLTDAGLDADVVYGVGYIDQGFLWELQKSALTPEKQHEARAFYLALRGEIDASYAQTVQSARFAWDAREVLEGVIIVRSNFPQHIREAVAFCIADAYPSAPPTSIIIEYDARVSVQETDFAPKLLAQFGGYVFGKGRCWGIRGEDSPPPVDKIIASIRQ